jgi:hypothetical protein
MPVMWLPVMWLPVMVPDTSLRPVELRSARWRWCRLETASFGEGGGVSIQRLTAIPVARAATPIGSTATLYSPVLASHPNASHQPESL